MIYCTNSFAFTADAGIIGGGCLSLMDPLLRIRFSENGSETLRFVINLCFYFSVEAVFR
jgi:hypothetical protein